MENDQNTLSRVGCLSEGFIHAREARDITERYKNSKLAFKIKAAAYAGKIGLFYDEPIDVETIKMLENLGYTVVKLEVREDSPFWKKTKADVLYNIEWR